MKQVLKLGGLFTAMIILAAFTRGADAVKGREAGGGTYVVIDGNVVLADPFYKAVGREHRFDAFAPEIQDYITSAEKLLERLAITNPSFWNDTVRGSKAIYIRVPAGEENRVVCVKYLPELTRDVEGHFQYGCKGKGNITYLFASFEQSRSLREQGKAIIHERLWVANPDVDQRFIAKFVTVLGKLMKRREDQIFRNNRASLTDAEIAEYDQLQMAAEQLGFETRKPLLPIGMSWKNVLAYPLSKSVVRNGGGLATFYYSVATGKYLPVTKVDATSFVGVGSVLGDQAELQNSVVLSSVLFAKTRLQNSVAVSSLISAAQINQSEIRDSELQQATAYPSVTTINYAMVTKSSIDTMSLLGSADAPVEINSSTAYGNYTISSVAAGAKLNNSVLRARYNRDSLRSDTGFNIQIQTGAILDNVRIATEFDTDMIVTAGTQVQNLNMVNRRTRGGGIFNSKLEFNSPSGPMNFGGLNCTLNERVLRLNSTADLNGRCEK
ncbi:MAG: hypothetical protein AB7N80_04975 [Bdellovibrionales bacterium]